MTHNAISFNRTTEKLLEKSFWPSRFQDVENESRFVLTSLHAKNFFSGSMFISALNASHGNCLCCLCLVQLFSVIWGRLENLMSVRPAVLTCLCLWTAAEGLCTSRHSTPLTQATHIILLCLFRTLHVWSSLSCPSYNSPLPLTSTGQVRPENAIKRSGKWCLSPAINVSYCCHISSVIVYHIWNPNWLIFINWLLDFFHALF